MKNGIDISKWQGDFTIPEGKKVDFSIIKLGGSDDGYYTDSQFKANYDKMKKLGIDVGGYYYTTVKTDEDVKREYEHILSIIEDRTFEYPIFIDVEDKYIINNEVHTRRLIESLLFALWSSRIYCGIYTTEYVYNKMNWMTYTMSKYPFWIAYWSQHMPDMLAFHRDIWQYGLNEWGVDGDVCYTDFPSIIKGFGFNHFLTDDEILEAAYAVIMGRYGCGEERKKLLREAGYPYDLVQEQVNKLM